ncbi:MAG TPA: sulfite exporter TauE/SafE family protein, partial [Lacipirellulaceae bacterium]|nr:sulfite exporter TauE/SafE family protein [Lacipirellulaceae bacterium]
SFTFSLMPAGKIQLIIAVLAVVSGANSIYRSNRLGPAVRSLGPWTLLAVGMGTGFLSALTGSSGPMVLLPILLWMSLGAVEAVGLAQVVQIPVGLFATAGNLAFGRVDLALAVLVGGPMVVGSILGAIMAHRVSAGTLKIGASLVLISAGAYYALISWP